MMTEQQRGRPWGRKPPLERLHAFYERLAWRTTWRVSRKRGAMFERWNKRGWKLNRQRSLKGQKLHRRAIRLWLQLVSERPPEVLD